MNQKLINNDKPNLFEICKHATHTHFKDPLIIWPGTYKSCRPYLSKPHYARTYFWVCSLQV